MVISQTRGAVGALSAGPSCWRLLCFGPLGAFVGSTMRLLGHACWLARVSLQCRSDVNPHEGFDHLRLALIPRARLKTLSAILECRAGSQCGLDA